MKTLQGRLNDLGACQDAITWVYYRDLPTAWAECQRGDWMLWLAGQRLPPDTRPYHRTYTVFY